MQLGHAHAGAMLLQQWGLPHEVIVACREHHNPDYQGLHHGLANLLLLVDRLLKPQGVGDACSMEIPDSLLERLDLSGHREQLSRDAEEIMEKNSTNADWFG
jgi:HD-like signal output (HDOD) protein